MVDLFANLLSGVFFGEFQSLHPDIHQINVIFIETESNPLYYIFLNVHVHHNHDKTLLTE